MHTGTAMLTIGAFAKASRPLAPGGTVVVDGLTPAASWPPRHEGAVGRARLHWLERPAPHAAEVRLAAGLSAVVGRRRPG
ncbi:hypothetical protein A8713_09490 [Streptomyces sp. SAT1]|uniref:hypothetical protein n=1 Tax=Streptomyces sp. SAT1 TaxID=1849967 RepID=UPI0007DDE9F8|nr:hypothetical protein [Streptomyces sp. SAT1]ANH91383.1 hypothetical protein A8713_09490 [Streptomyces sp. SAT1]